MRNKTIYIVRHGETEYNRLGIVQGSGIDKELNEYGQLQALALYEYYKAVPFDVVITSRLQRTHQTMRSFIEQGIPWEQFKEINEMNWGHYEGKPSSPAMHADYLVVKEQWNKGIYDARLPGAESAAELGERLNRFIEHLWNRKEKHILVCSHGRAMCGLVSLMNGEPLSEMNKYKHSNTGLWRLHYDGEKAVIDLENDTRHLSLLANQSISL